MSYTIPTNDQAYTRLVQKWQMRFLRAVQDTSDHFEKCRRQEMWWSQTAKEAAGGDEYAIMLGMAFSIVEGMHAKITEPLFQMGLPCDTYPRRRGHVRQAQNMQHVQRAFYQGPNFQEALSLSKKSMVAVGHRFEFDTFLHVEREGKRWGLVDQKVEVPLRKDGTPIGQGAINAGTAKGVVKVLAEIPFKRPVHYGFWTEYPRWDQVHTEPGRHTIDTGQKTDVTWLTRDQGFLTLEELAREVRYDVNAKKNVPMYDFERLLKDAGKGAQDRFKRIMDGGDGAADNYGSVIQPIRAWDYQPGRHGGTYEARRDQAQSLEDRDVIWVVECREMGEILTIAQGKYVIKRVVDPWHTPGLKARVENYTTDLRGRLRGRGALEPVEGELGELDDMHGLSMQNVFRIVNRMLYVREDAIVNEDDFNSRAGGLVRIKSDQADVRGAVSESAQSSPVNEMRAVEADLRGLIEKVTGELDGGAGDGIAAANKTAKGTQMFVSALSPIYARFQRQARINEVRRCMNMADILDQFAFEKTPYRVVRPDGSTVFAEFDRSDLSTDGVGFEFGFSMDPMWGNAQQRLAMKRQVYEDGLKFAQVPKELKGPNCREPNLDELFEDILQESGYTDTSKIFRRPDGSMTTEDEYAILAQGGVVQKCVGDLRHHIEVHLLQAKSPVLAANIKAGKASPQTPQNLRLLVQQAVAEMKTFLANPEGAAMERLNQAGMAHPGEAQ